jgi:hypothetical protein
VRSDAHSRFALCALRFARYQVFFITEPKVGVKAIKDVAMHMKEEQDSTSKVSRSIIIIEEKITPFARQSLTEMQPKIMIEVFKEAELLVNITHHVLVPKHRVLSPMEKKTLLERYKVGVDLDQRVPPRPCALCSHSLLSLALCAPRFVRSPGQGDAAAAHSVQRPDCEVLRDGAGAGRAYREVERDRGPLCDLPLLRLTCRVMGDRHLRVVKRV